MIGVPNSIHFKSFLQQNTRKLQNYKVEEAFPLKFQVLQKKKKKGYKIDGCDAHGTLDLLTKVNNRDANVNKN